MEDIMTKSDETSCSIPKIDDFRSRRHGGPEFHSVYSGDQKMQLLKDSEANIEDLDIASKENEHLMDLIVVPLLES